MSHLRASKTALVIEFDSDFAVFFSGRVEAIDISGIFEHNHATAATREFHIVVGEIGHLGSGFGDSVVDEYVHAIVAVADVVDFVANPHRSNVLTYGVGDIGNRLIGRVVNPYIVGHTALVVFPSAKFAEYAVVGEAFAVGRVRAEATFGQRQFLRHTAVERRYPEFACEAIAYAIAINHALAVGSPSHGNVVRTHTVGHFVARIGGSESNALGFAALARHNEDFGVAVVLAGESYGFAIGRETGKHLVAVVRSEALGHATGNRHGVDVAGIGERHISAVGGGESHESPLVGPRR